MGITTRVDLRLNGVWTDVTEDIAPAPIRIEYGIDGDGINDRVASPGQAVFWMRNGPYNSAGKEGYYSPDHGNKRDGFELGIEVRVVFSVAGRRLVKFVGTVDAIQPEAGPGRRFTQVFCVDWLEEAATRKIGGLELRENVRANELFEDVLASMPIQPPAVQIEGIGQELYRFAFDTAERDKVVALTELQRIAQSDGAYIYLRGGELVDPVPILSSSVADPTEIATDGPHGLTTGQSVTIEGHSGSTPDINGSHTVTVTGEDTFTIDVEVTVGGAGGTLARQAPVPGTLVFEARTTRTRKSTNVATFTDQDLRNLDVERSRRTLLNAVQLIAHPRRLGDDDTTVIFRAGQPVQIQPNSTRTFFGSYVDQVSRQRIGGTDQQTPVAHTDYVFNTAEDGSGTDVTDQVTVMVSLTASGFSFQLTNPLTQVVYATLLQIRGRPIFDFQQVELIAKDDESIALHGERAATVDMTYQDDVAVADEFAQYLLATWKQSRSRVQRVGIKIGSNDDKALAVLLREPGDRIGIQETVTGLATTTQNPATTRGFFIQSVALTAKPGAQNIVDVEFGLLRADATQYWILDQPGASELDQTTRLGFGLVVGHTDLPHQDQHGDVAHEDVAHSDSHTDTHGDAAHGDSAHSDAHQDVPHQDVAHGDAHSDQSHDDDPHGDSHSDVAHSDVAHSDIAHADFAHEDAPHVDHDDLGTVPTHDDSHGDQLHVDIPHGDSHADSPHSDSHSDVSHDDDPHGDSHSDVAHSDQGHSDVHDDQGHSDTAHVDDHGDVPHVDVLHDDVAHGDTHTDVPHGDG